MYTKKRRSLYYGIGRRLVSLSNLNGLCSTRLHGFFISVKRDPFFWCSALVSTCVPLQPYPSSSVNARMSLIITCAHRKPLQTLPRVIAA
jgi:hypothetical protein